MKIKKYMKEEFESTLQEAGPMVNLKRYGFVRAPEEDFSDDGNRFTCYWYDPDHTGDKSYRASYLRYDGDVYLDVHYYNDKTRKTTYFSDLNGVSVEEAVAGLPDLVKELEDHRAKMKEYQAYTFTDDKKSEVLETAYDIVKAYKRIGQSFSIQGVIEKALEEHGISNEDVVYDDMRALTKTLDARVRNEKTVSEDIIKTIAQKALKDILTQVRGTPNHFDSRGHWREGTAPVSLDKALTKIYASAGNYPDLIYFDQLPDKDQERIVRWIRKKVEPLLDDTFDESMKESIDMSYINKNLEAGESKTVLAADPAYVSAQETEKTLEDNMGKVMKDKAEEAESIETKSPEEGKAQVRNIYTNKVELSEDLFEDFFLQDDGEEDMWTKVFNELVSDLDPQDTHREIKHKKLRRYNADRVFTINDSDIAVDVSDEEGAQFAKEVADHYGCRYEITKSPAASKYSQKYPYRVIIYTSEFMNECKNPLKENSEPRYYTNKLLAHLKEQDDPEVLLFYIDALLQYMSEDEVSDFVHNSGYEFNFDEEEEQ